MHIVVILRTAPDSEEEYELDESETGLDREWLDFMLNEFDEYALEEALVLKDTNPDVTVTAIAVEDQGIDRALQDAVAKGADRALKIEHDFEQALDSAMLSLIYQHTLPSLQPDLVLVGVQSPSDLFGQLSPLLAARIGWPQASVINRVAVGEGGVVVEQDYSGGRLGRLAVSLPAVLGIQSSSQPPRYVSGSRLREVRSQGVVETMPCPELAADRDLAIERLASPEASHAVTRLEGDPGEVARQLVAILRERKLV